MAVTRDFSYLNSLRPAGARFGEVVAIALYHVVEVDGMKVSSSFGYTKRKSIHVSPATNAYWNMMGLCAEINRFVTGESNASRAVRREMKNGVVQAVHLIHEFALRHQYGLHEHVTGSQQYYEIFMEPIVNGWRIGIETDLSPYNGRGHTIEQPTEIYHFHVWSPLS